MVAYVIAQIDVTDPERFAAYREKVPATIERYGGRYRARGGEVTPFEGDSPRSRVDDVDAARRWYGSEEYAPLIVLRQSASVGSLFVVDGGRP